MTAVPTPVRRATAAAGLICFAATATAAASDRHRRARARARPPTRAPPRRGRPVRRPHRRAHERRGRRARLGARGAAPGHAARTSGVAAPRRPRLDDRRPRRPRRAVERASALAFRPPRPGSSRLRLIVRGTDGAASGSPRRRAAQRLPPRPGLVVRPGALRQPPGVRRAAGARDARRRAQDAALRHARHAPPPRPDGPRARGRPRPVRGRPRVRPHGRDPRAAGLLAAPARCSSTAERSAVGGAGVPSTGVPLHRPPRPRRVLRVRRAAAPPGAARACR